MPAFITEYVALARDGFSFHIAAGKEPAIAEQAVTFTASTRSAALNAQTAFVMVHVTETCHLAFGPNPTAVTTAHRMAANETRFYGVVPGHKIAFVAGS